MKSPKLFLALLATIILLHAAAASAAGIDMNDPRRALGREGNVRVDAQLTQETVSPNTPIGVTWQVENLSHESVAVASTVADASYDEDSRTITLALGSEIPPDGRMSQMVLIAPGEKKVFRTAATAALGANASRGGLFAAVPRYVQVKVAILRDVKPFLPLLETQTRTPRVLTDAQFEQWFECNDTIFLNSLPVQFAPSRDLGGSAERAARGSM